MPHNLKGGKHEIFTERELHKKLTLMNISAVGYKFEEYCEIINK